MAVIDIFKTDNKYSVIYADPAWAFNNKKTGGSMGSSAESQYRVTCIEDMKKLPVKDLANENCLLVMWYVGAMPEEAIALCKAWGFKLKNMNGFVWDKATKTDKDYFGMGFYTRASTESCLIAVKGKASEIIKNHSVRAKIRAKVELHSVKPKEFREAIEKLCGDVPRIELFSRKIVDGWDCWGDHFESENANVS